ncbi:MAG: cation:dicarboxylase symporter family transporter [Treponema sp.]|nr:cation:dicarboxylase symporter family transporter [Treponema sp.]
MFGKILKNPITIFLAVGLGIVFGIYEKSYALSLGIIGDAYLNLFQMTVIPILVTSIVASLAQLMKDKNARSHILKIIFVFLIMLTATSFFGAIAGYIGRPGENLGESTTEVLDSVIKDSADTSNDEIALYDATGDTAEKKSSLVDFFFNIIPSNIFSAFSSGSILQLVFFSIIFGIAIGFLREDYSNRLINGAISLKESFQKLINWTMYGLPVGLVFLMGKQIAQVGVEILLAMVKFIVVFYIAGLAAILICTIIIWLKSGIKNPFKVLRKVIDPIIICFATRNSFAALPSSISALKALKYDHNTVDLVFPLGLTVLRFGNILYFAFASCFIAQIYDTPLSIPTMALIIVGSLLAGTATAGASGLLTLPMISLIMDPIGLPVESILVVFMAIDSLIDPMRTLLIVYVNIATTALVSSKKKKGQQEELPDKETEYIENTETKAEEIITEVPVEENEVAFDTVEKDEKISRPYATKTSDALGLAVPKRNAALRPAVTVPKSHDGIKVRIRDALIIVNTILLVATAAIIMRINSRGTQDSVYSVSSNLVTEILKSVDTKLEAYYDPASQEIQNILYHYWNDDTYHFLTDKEIALDYFMQVLDTHKEFAMVYFGDTKGNLIMGRRMPDGSLTRRYITRTDDTVYTQYVHENKIYNATFPNTTESTVTGYDPRTRGWYKKAVTQKHTVWTNVYIFATDNMPGFSCASPIYDSDGNLMGVACIDIGIRDLSLYLGSISTPANSRLFIYDQDNQIIAKPMKADDSIDTLLNVYPAADGTNSYSMKSVDDASDPIIANAFNSGQSMVNTEDGIYMFESEGKNYFCKVDSMTIDQELSLNVGMIVPDEDIMGTVYKNNKMVMMISVIVILIAIIISILISSLISKPMKILSNEMNNIRDLSIVDDDEDINSGIKEIDTMVFSFQGMKQGLMNFKKYVPADLVSMLIRNNQNAEIGGRKQVLTLMFSDIENFTGIAEKTKPEELINRLYDYFSLLAHTITDNKGTIDKYIGDSIMAFWGAPVDIEVKTHARLACLSALTCQMQGFNLSNV